jgi:hypothetical protein
MWRLHGGRREVVCKVGELNVRPDESKHYILATFWFGGVIGLGSSMPKFSNLLTLSMIPLLTLLELLLELAVSPSEIQPGAVGLSEKFINVGVDRALSELKSSKS